VAHPDKHTLVSIGVGHACQAVGTHPVIGCILALWTHLPLDLMNGPWYHGWGSRPWKTVLYALSVAVFMGLSVWWIVRHPELIPYAVFANLPDIEHPIRLLVGKKDYWIHGDKVMKRPELRGEWGMLAWTVLGVLLVLCTIQL